MNERIRELEKLATETVKCGLNGTSTAESFNRKKFAELIVQECSNFLKDTLDDHFAAEQLEEHFGVEE